MLPNRLSLAFKEWASVVAALAVGRQSIILRKGGLNEEGGSFELKNPSFLLFPTYEHQNLEDLSPEGREFLKPILETASHRDAQQVEFDYCAKVEKSFWVDDLDKLFALWPYHVLSEQSVKKRFLWGDNAGLHIFLVRVYRLGWTERLDARPEYSGCKSWVTLERDIPVQQATPVLPDDAYAGLQNKLTQLLT